MSFRLTKLAMNADFQDDPVAKNVMIALCWSYFDGASYALLNQARLCFRTGYKKRTVQDALARLKAQPPDGPTKGAAAAPFSVADKSGGGKAIDRAYGLINVDYFGTGSGNSPKYTINVARLEAMQLPEQLSFKLTALRAVEPEQKGAAAASFAETGEKAVKGAAAASLAGEKGAADAKKGAAAAPYHENVILPYTTHTDNGKTADPSSVRVCVEEQPAKTRSRFSLKQWFAYAKVQPNIKNPMAFAATRFQTTEHDGVLELHLEIERQNKFAQQKAPSDCSVCRGTGWETVPGKGAKPCGCRPKQGAAQAN